MLVHQVPGRTRGVPGQCELDRERDRAFEPVEPTSEGAKDRAVGCNPRGGKECTMVHTCPAGVVFYVRNCRLQITDFFGPQF